MTRRQEEPFYVCAAECGRSFGSRWSFERHRLWKRGRCKGDRELKRLGLRKDDEGVWRRRSPVGEQARLPGIHVRGGARNAEQASAGTERPEATSPRSWGSVAEVA